MTVLAAALDSLVGVLVEHSKVLPELLVLLCNLVPLADLAELEGEMA